MLRCDRLGAGIEEREAPGAVSSLDHAGLGATLPHGCGLLVAGEPENADRAAQQIRHRRSEVVGTIADLREQRCRHAEQLTQVQVPFSAADVEEQRARRIGRIARMGLAAGQPP